MLCKVLCSLQLYYAIYNLSYNLTLHTSYFEVIFFSCCEQPYIILHRVNFTFSKLYIMIMHIGQFL